MLLGRHRLDIEHLKPSWWVSIFRRSDRTRAGAQIYDRLEVAEITGWLEQGRGVFDLIVSTEYSRSGRQERIAMAEPTMLNSRPVECWLLATTFRNLPRAIHNGQLCGREALSCGPRLSAFYLMGLMEFSRLPRFRFFFFFSAHFCASSV
jgi:hypothetical protein